MAVTKLTDKLKAIADNIRAVTGTTEPLTLDQMAENVTALEVPPSTYILVDDAGNEYTAALVDEEVELTATANDIRIGTTAVTNNGVETGTKVIPSYHTRQGCRIITKGSSIIIKNQDVIVDDYDYTRLQALVCIFNTNEADSVSTQKVSINNSVYNVQSTDVISEVTKNHDTKEIDLGIINDTDSMLIVRYFMYKEI